MVWQAGHVCAWRVVYVSEGDQWSLGRKISGLASKGWNASAIASNVLGVDSLWWAQPDYRVRVTLPESVLAQITQWLKESKLNNSTVSNYEVQEWERQTRITRVGRLS